MFQIEETPQPLHWQQLNLTVYNIAVSINESLPDTQCLPVWFINSARKHLKTEAENICWKYTGNLLLLGVLHPGDVLYTAPPAALLSLSRAMANTQMNQSRLVYTALNKNGKSYLPLKLLPGSPPRLSIRGWPVLDTPRRISLGTTNNLTADILNLMP